MRAPPSLRGGLGARYLGLVFGLFLCAAGIVAALESRLGLSPWDVLHQGLAQHTPLTFGVANVVVGVVVLAVAALLGARVGPGTVANAVLIGLFIEILLHVPGLDSIGDASLATRVAVLLAGIALMAVGSAFYLGASLGAGPRDSLMLVARAALGVADRRRADAARVERRRRGGRPRRNGRSRDDRVRAPDRAGARVVAVGALPFAPRAPGSSITRGMNVKGLICAGGEATRLGELTRSVNKHLLPVGDWPMIYYPLQLLQLAGVREVMIVTGQGHAGQLIDLLGDGRMRARGADEPLFDLDLTYKVQVEAGGIAQVVGMAESFAGSDKLVVCLGDNIFEYAEAPAIRAFAAVEDGAAVFVKEVPDPERFGVVVYGDDGRVTDVVEKAGLVDLRYPSPPSHDAVVGLYCYSPDVFDVIRGLRPSSRGRARDHRREPALRRGRHARLPPRQRLVGGRRARRSRSRRSAS